MHITATLNTPRWSELDDLQWQIRVVLHALLNSPETVTDYAVDLVYDNHEFVAVTTVVDEWSIVDIALSERAVVKTVVLRLRSESLSGDVLDLEEELKSVKEILPRLQRKGLLDADIVVSCN